MMTVRFESGYSVTYNQANYIHWAQSRDTFHKLQTRKNGGLIAMVPGSCLIEWEHPCRIDKPTESRRMDDVDAELRGLKYQVKQLRSELKPKSKKKK